MSSTLAELTRSREGDEPDDVLFHSLYGVRLVELNRPAKFNALNASMARKILPRLKVGEPIYIYIYIYIYTLGLVAWWGWGGKRRIQRLVAKAGSAII